MAQGPGNQGHTKPLTLTITLKLMPGTINLMLLNPGLGPGPGGGPGTQMAQGSGTQGHTKPLTLTLTLKLMPGTINLTLLGPRTLCTGTDFLEDSPCIEKLHTSHTKIAFSKESVVFPS